MKYYKIVFQQTWLKHDGSNNKVSCIVSPSRTIDLTVVYSLNKWTYPKKYVLYSKLFVFDTLENAYNIWNILHNMSLNYQCYECEVKNPQSIKLVAGILRVHNIQNFWKNRHNKKKTNGHYAPKGTIVCDAVKLIRQIPYNRKNLNENS